MLREATIREIAIQSGNKLRVLKAEAMGILVKSDNLPETRDEAMEIVAKSDNLPEIKGEIMNLAE